MSEFSPRIRHASWAERRRAGNSEDSWIAFLRNGREIRKVLELGPGTGSRAAHLLRENSTCDYRAFEPSPELLAKAQAALSPFAERASAEGRNLALQLPLENHSIDLVLCLDLFEFLPMDQLYMVLAESRRALRPGGLCILRSLSHGRGLRGILAEKFLSLFPRLYGGRRPLELNHYISPEDWKVISDERVKCGWLSRQTVVMERLPDLPAGE
ncbi:MAG: class I SAM-dependent methyltransferase [Bdellovibrionota bacterium]